MTYSRDIYWDTNICQNMLDRCDETESVLTLLKFLSLEGRNIELTIMNIISKWKGGSSIMGRTL